MRDIRQNLLKGITKCKNCGNVMLMQGYDEGDPIAHMMEVRSICYECAFWEYHVSYPPEDMEVIDGICYKIMPMIDSKNKAMWLGGRGKVKYILKNDGTIRQSNDIWTIGKVPEKFTERLPNTAIWITKRVFSRLSYNNKRCLSRGCLDRYRCYHYKRELELKSGPFNKVPPKWKVGGEHCRVFLDIKDIPGYKPIALPHIKN